MPVGLDLGAVGDHEADRAEQALDALEGAAHRVQAALHATTPGQGDVERLGGELGEQRGFAQRVAAALECGLDRGLGGVDRGARLAARLGLELAERLQALGERAGLAEIARLGLFELRAVGRGGEFGGGQLYQLIELFHVPALAECGVAG